MESLIEFRVLEDIAAERRAQNAKWGGPEHDDDLTSGNWTTWIDVLVEHATKAYSTDNSPEAYREARRRFVEVAAVAIAAVESLDRLDDYA